MKTVIDAVNEFEGELPIHFHDFFINYDHGFFSIEQFLRLEGYICTTGEFNDLVSQMETNFGKCSDVAVNHWKKCTKVLLTKSTKELETMDIWKDAPESATHYDIEAECFCKNDGYWITGNRARYVQDNRQIQWGDEDRYTPRPIFIDCKVNNKPQPTIAYTQAMTDNGELPSVGMECLVLNTNCSNPKYIKALIKYVGDLVIYAYVENGERCDNVKTLKFKPLTPPIELIDKGLYLFDINHKTKLVGEAYYTDIGACWMITNLRTNTSYQAVMCTNIQPLTVEVK